MSPSVHVDNKGKYILILGKVPTEVLGGHWLSSDINVLDQLYQN